MKITIVTAVSIILAGGITGGVEAQISSRTAEPAEFPPASYQGRQYVDSRGCIFIRAGVDGNIAWIPRVNRARQQLCGAEPTKVAGTSSQKPAGPQPDIITLAPEAESRAAAPVRTATPTPVSNPPVAAVKPQRTPEMTSAGQAEATLAPARPVRRAPQPVAAAPAPVAPTTVPVAAARVRTSDNPLAQITPNTRILPVHVYLERRKSEDLQVPEGYRVAWEDDRLNIHRAEQTIRPTVLSDRAVVPEGYAPADRADNRMNRLRGVRTPQGDAQMAQVWSDSLPRRPVERALNKTPFVLWDAKAKYGIVPPRRGGAVVTRLSTRSAPDAVLPDTSSVQAAPRYIRAATLADPAQARAVARDLAAATGLQMRLGSVTRNGQTLKVVLSGPFTAGAEQALQRIRAAGFSGARLSK